MTGVLIAGTSSDAGKSAIVTGLCRAFRRRGISVAPFKAQNMSNNSMVCPDGAEIGRAQYLQAQAAQIQPSALLNPVLLKPGSDRRSHIVLLGKPHGQLHSGEYATGRQQLADAAFAAYEKLADQFDLVVCEGAGSPAEINLRQGDYVNMGLASRFNLPTILVGDIDRGGVLASIYGTWALLQESDRQLLRGYLINKFRGDQAVLEPGLAEISARTGLINFGVLPFLTGVWTDGEDALEVQRWTEQPGSLKIAVIRLPRISNSTDVDALAAEPEVEVSVSTNPKECAAADLVVVPGSRATVNDLRWLHEQGLAQMLVERHREGKPIIGICGGYQMFAEHIFDGVENADSTPGLGLLSATIKFSETKITRQASYQWANENVAGYEIHHGLVEATGEVEPFLDGMRVGNTFGTMLHGAFENDDFRQAFLTEVAVQTGACWQPDPNTAGYTEIREAMIENLACALTENVDLDKILEVAREHEN